MKTAVIGSLVDPVSTWDPRRDADEAFTYVDLSSVDQQWKAITEPTSVEPPDAPSRARQLLVAGDVLVSTVRPNLNAVAVVPENLDGATGSTGFCVLRPGPGKVDGRYLFHWVRSPTFVGQMVTLATGASYPAVSDKVVKGSEIPLPPIEEQRRIAAVLDAADALRAKRRQALAKLDTLTEAVFNEMFGSDAGDDRWPRLALSDACEMYQPQTISGKDLVEDGEYPVYGANGLIGFYDRFNHPDREVTVTCRGATCGTVNVIPGPSWITGNAMVVRPLDDRLCKGYLASALTMIDYGNVITGAAQPQITREPLGRATIPVPSPAAQTTFSRRREEIDRISARLHASAARLKDLYAAIQQRAFLGEL